MDGTETYVRAHSYYAAIIAPTLGGLAAGWAGFWLLLACGWLWLLIGPAAVTLTDAVHRGNRAGQR